MFKDVRQYENERREDRGKGYGTKRGRRSDNSGRYPFSQPVSPRNIGEKSGGHDSDCGRRVTGLTGLCDRSVRALRKALREGGPLQLLSIKKGSGRKSRTADVESQIFEELEKSDYHTRQQVADMIEEKFHIKISVSAVGKPLKKRGFKILKCGQIPAKADVAAQKTFCVL